MNTRQIDETLRRVCGDKFVGVFARDQLPVVRRRPALMVVNTDPSTKPCEHWTAIYLGDAANSSTHSAKNRTQLYRTIWMRTVTIG